jgi:hypothetical protein
MLETFHVLMIKITYTPHIYADFHTQKTCRSSNPLSNKTPIKMTLSNYLSKKMWVMQKKKKKIRNKSMLKSMVWISTSPRKKEKKKERKPTSQISKEGESYTKGVHT